MYNYLLWWSNQDPIKKSLVYTRSVSTSANAHAAHGKNDVNIEEMIADVGFGFHAKVKVSFLKPEKVNMLVFLCKKKMQARSPTASLV